MGSTWPAQPATGMGVEVKELSPKTAKASSPTPENTSLYRTKVTCHFTGQKGPGRCEQAADPETGAQSR